MSWIVQTLLRDSVNIRSKSEIESDSFTDLLFLEKKIDELFDKGVITDEELELIGYFSGNTKLGNELAYTDRRIVQRKFVALCAKIAYYLGGGFTDEGYLDYIQKKYNLNEEEVETLRTYMKGKYRHRLSRKIKNGK